LAPALDAIATSTDENGFEWYAESNGSNWYRHQGSGGEWSLHI